MVYFCLSGKLRLLGPDLSLRTDFSLRKLNYSEINIYTRHLGIYATVRTVGVRLKVRFRARARVSVRG